MRGISAEERRGSGAVEVPHSFTWCIRNEYLDLRKMQHTHIYLQKEQVHPANIVGSRYRY